MARSGYVYDPYGVPISGVTVNAYRPDRQIPLATTTTDPYGRWTFEHYATLPALAGYRIEIINGAQTIEIEGEKVKVTLPPMPKLRPWPGFWKWVRS